MNYKGKYWNDKDLEIYEIQGHNIVLNGWNGEKYLHCFELAENLIDVISGKEEYIVIPVYENEKIIDYKFELEW